MKAPTLCRVVQELKDDMGIATSKASSLHHELVGGKRRKMIENTAIIVKVLAYHGNLFLKSDMLNLATLAVTPSNVCSDIEDCENLWQKALVTFVSSIVHKTVRFWDKIRVVFDQYLSGSQINDV